MSDSSPPVEHVPGADEMGSRSWGDIGEVKRLADRVDNMCTVEHEQILRIIRSYGAKYTINGNGVFCDITHAPFDMLDAIQDFVEFSAINRSLLSEERRRNTKSPIPRQRKDRGANASRRAEKFSVFPVARVNPIPKPDSGQRRRKEACRYHLYRRRYSKETPCRPGIVDELRCE